MSKIHKELRHSPDSRWFIRIDNGDTYGPVDLKTLQEWASQGRVDPNNEVSEDQESWQRAESLPELEMDWMAELEDGTIYGPFNIDLAPELANSGVLPDNATLKHRANGETRTMGTDTNGDDDHPTLPFDDTPAAPKKPKRKAQTKRPRKKTASTATPPETETPDAPAETVADAPDTTEIDSQAITPEPEEEPDTTPAATPEATAATSEPKPEPAAATHAEDANDSREVVSQRLETLQKSASQARAQLAATRKQLTEQRAATTAMQDQIRKLQDDVRTAETVKGESERRLLEQQDTVAQATAEAENLNAQLQQLHDHYDRLQIESQNQFEELDRLRADAMENEQTYKHNITQEADRVAAKTALLGEALRLISQDEDLEKGHIPTQLLTAADPGQLQDLQARLSHLQQQADSERQHARQIETQLAAASGSRTRNVFVALLVVVVLGLICALAYVLGTHRNEGSVTKRRGKTTTVAKKKIVAPPSRPVEQTALAGLIVTNSERLPLMTSGAAELDLPPEEQKHLPATPARDPIDWPELSIARSTISTSDSRCRLAFTYGVFSSGTQLKEEARHDLVQLSNQLRERIDEFSLLVEGHTDATPIKSSRSKYVDNYALGMARAEQVKLFLEDQCHLPAESIQTASAGEADPPHPNSSDAGRLKNRTVVLTLTPR